MKLRVGQSMLVVRVPHGQVAPEGFTHRDSSIGSHHGRYSTHAVKIIKKPRKKRRRKKPHA